MNFSLFDRARNSVGPLEADLIDAYAAGAVSRRTFVTRGSVLGLGVAFMGTIIAACGSDEKSADNTTAGTTAGTAAAGESTPATTATPAGAIKQGGTLRVAAQKPGSPLDPVAMDNLGSYTPCTQSFEYLAGKGEDVELAPGLAESWSPNADGSVWTFKLRPNVLWHDDTPFTAADVVATMDRLAGGNLAASLAAGSAVAIDDLTVEMTLLNPDGQFPYQLSWSNPQSLITPADYVVGTTLDQRPAGTGPWKLDKYDVATGATFVRNEKWWGGTTYLDKVEWIYSDDLATQITGLQGGAADAIVQFSVVGGDALFTDPNITVEAFRSAAHRQIWMNTREGTFADVRVRQAVALGLDRQALIDNVLKGKGDIGNDHPIAPLYAFWDSAQEQRGRDIEKAKALLEEAGKTGLKITMFVPKLQEIPQLAELVQTQLKDIGMEITLDVQTLDTFYSEWCKTYDPICDGGQEFGIVDYGHRGTPDVYLVKAYATGEWNSAHYVSEEFNTAVKEYQAASDVPGRATAIKNVQAIATEDTPYVIPYFYNSLTAHVKSVSGIVVTGLGHFELAKAGFTE